MFKKLSIKMKLISLITMALTIIMCSVTVVTLNFFKSEIKDIFQNETAEKVSFLNTYLESYIDTPINLVEATAREVSKVSTNKEIKELQENLQQKSSGVQGILGLHVAFEGDKKLYSSENVSLEKDYDSNERDWYKQSLESPNEIIITEPYTDAITGKLIVGISKSIANGKGVVTLDLDLAFLEELISAIKIGKQGYTFVLDNEGEVLYHPNYEQNESLVDLSFYKAFMKNNYLETTMDGETIYLNRFYNEQMNWQIGSSYSQDEIREIYKPLIMPITIINTICIIILAVVFYFIIRKFLNPITSITEVASKVAEGDLKQQLQVKTEDEIGQLSKSFNEMNTGLKEIIGQVNKAANTLNEVSIDVSANIEENVQSIHQVVENVHEVSYESSEQLKSTKQVQQVVQKIGSEITEINVNIQEVENSSQLVKVQTTDGVLVMDETLDKMRMIESSTKDTKLQFESLLNVVNQIASFSKLISRIADQTNLLALNASIEAARAGEHGKGFAVVADEVRKLAEETASSVKEIQILVASIENMETDAKFSMQASNEAVVKGIEQITSVNKVFNTINEAMLLLGNKIDVTQQAIINLDQSKAQVMNAVEEISEATNRVSNNIEQVAATTEEQNASMEQMAIAAQHLTEQAEQLQQSMKKFSL